MENALEKMLLNKREGKYQLVLQARDWMHVLRKKEENMGVSEADLIKMALEEIVSGKVTPEEITKAYDKIKATAVKEESIEEADEKKLRSKDMGKKSDKKSK